MREHYYSVEFDNNYAVYFTDFAVDAFVFNLPLDSEIVLIVKQLNEAYHNGFRDGQNSSLNEKYTELVNDNISMSMKLHRLERKGDGK